MQKHYHQKLIRDKIPKFIEERGGNFETRVLDNEEFEEELKKKLVEEAKEVVGASDKEMLNELSDVLELVKSIAARYKIGFEEVVRYQEKKREERGAFGKRLFLIWSDK